MEVSIKNQILAILQEKDEGYVFCAKDFSPLFEQKSIHKALSKLVKESKIRRVMQGIYDLPAYSVMLKRHVSTDMHQVAHAIARKNNWKIYPDGNTLLNYFSLSTQVVAKYIYLSTGVSKKYKVDGVVIEFKHIPTKEHSLGNSNAIIVVQAIKAMGKADISEKFIESFARKFTTAEWKDIYESISSLGPWICNTIQEIYRFSQKAIR